MVLSKGEKAYQVGINIVLIIVTLVMILPIVLLFMCSITDENTLINNGYSFFPEKFGLTAYQYIWQNRGTVLRSYGLTIVVTVIGTACTLILTSLIAYPLSLRNLPGRPFFNFYVFFTMLFSGGLVPAYIMWTNTFHIKNTIFAYLLPNLLLSAYNIILVRSYFVNSLPMELFEAASIDGCSNARYIFHIAIPLSKAIIAVIALYVAVSYWNSYFYPMIFLSTESKFPLQLFLRQLLLIANMNTASTGTDPTAAAQLATMASVLKYSVIVVSTVPIICVYPFIQKYFVQGVMIGSIKG